MSKDGKMADGKMCCSSNKCPMHAKAAKPAAAAAATWATKSPQKCNQL